MPKKSPIIPLDNEDKHLVRFDPEKRLNYHLDDGGRRIYHGCPEGFAFNENGALQPLKSPTEGETSLPSSPINSD